MKWWQEINKMRDTRCVSLNHFISSRETLEEKFLFPKAQRHAQSTKGLSRKIARTWRKELRQRSASTWVSSRDERLSLRKTMIFLRGARNAMAVAGLGMRTLWIILWERIFATFRDPYLFRRRLFSLRPDLPRTFPTRISEFIKLLRDASCIIP